MDDRPDSPPSDLPGQPEEDLRLATAMRELRRVLERADPEARAFVLAHLEDLARRRPS